MFMLTKTRPQTEKTLDLITATAARSAKAVQAYCKKAQNPDIIYRGGKGFKLQPVEPERLEDTVKMEQEATNEEIEQIIADYANAEKEFQTLRGSDLTDDTKLLDGSFAFDPQALKDLATKYVNNYSMHMAIVNYGKEKGITIYPLQSAQSRADIVRGFFDMVYPRYLECTTVPYTASGGVEEVRMTGTVEDLVTACGHYKARALKHVY